MFRTILSHCSTRRFYCHNPLLHKTGIAEVSLSLLLAATFEGIADMDQFRPCIGQAAQGINLTVIQPLFGMLSQRATTQVVAQCQTALRCQYNDAFQFRIGYPRLYAAVAGRAAFLLFVFVHIKCKSVKRLLYNSPSRASLRVQQESIGAAEWPGHFVQHWYFLQNTTSGVFGYSASEAQSAL